MDGSSHGEITEPEDVSIDEMTETEEAWTRADRIRALDEGKSVVERLKKISEAMSPVDAVSSEAEGYMEERHSAGVSDEPPDEALDAKTTECSAITECSCQISSAVENEWARAMKVGDCVTLLRALKTSPCLLAIVHMSTFDDEWEGISNPYIGPGNTALHWAAKRRCLKLLVYILSLFLDDNGKVVKEFVHGVTTIDRKDYFQRRNDTGLTAADLLWSVRDYSIYAYFSNFMQSGKIDLALTIKEMQLELLDPMYVSPTSTSPSASISVRVSPTSTSPSTGSTSPSTGVSMRESVLKATRKCKMLLDNMLASDYNYNFVEEYDELLFHFACGHLDSNECEEYVTAVIRELVKEGPETVAYLFNYCNAQGQAPMHCACIDLQNLRKFLELLRVELGQGEEYGDCYNSRDVGGWTVLHVAASQGDEDVVKALLKEKRVDVNARVESGDRKATALHLAIIHDRSRVVRLLIERGNADVNAILWGNFSYRGVEMFAFHTCTPLYLAAILGRSAIVKALIKHPQVYDGTNYSEISAVHIAAIGGDPKMLRYFMNNPKFDTSATFKGCSALHFVIGGSHFGGDFRRKSIKSYFHNKSVFARSRQRFKGVYHVNDEDKMACISMLVQAGLDVWQKNDKGNFPEPGPNASRALRQFWYQKLLTHTQDSKNNLNVAGNAISVVSALVVTASYVGPLQPPLGLESNSVQDSSLLIRVYMTTNTLSFYMAVASIIFAIVPSLPMPQEGLYEEWQRSQKSIIYAIHLLLLAVMNILISFGTASNVVVSSEYSWQHQGLVFYPTLFGGLICVIAIILFYLRLLRLTFVKNVTIKHVYQHVFRAIQNVKEKDENDDDLTGEYWLETDVSTDDDESLNLHGSNS